MHRLGQSASDTLSSGPELACSGLPTDAETALLRDRITSLLSMPLPGTAYVRRTVQQQHQQESADYS